MSAKSKADSSYHYQLLTYLQSDEMEDQIGLMPVGLRDQLCCCIVVQSLSRYLLETWIPETLQLIGAQLEGPDEMTATGPPKRPKKEVNRFIGWAIHSMTKIIRKKLKGVTKTHEDDSAEA